MEQRLEELRAEYQRGFREMALLDQRRQELHRTLLRISGAIQVLEELLDREPDTKPDDAGSAGAAVRVVGA